MRNSTRSSRKSKEAPNNSKDGGKQRKRPIDETEDSLKKEMELIGYGRGKSGQNRRKLEHSQFVDRRRKRRQLEDQEDELSDGEDNVNFRRSVPAGLTVADHEQRVIEESLVFRPETLVGLKTPEEDDEDEDDDDNDDDESDDEEDDDQEEEEETTSKRGRVQPTGKKNANAKKKRRKQRRLKTFRSFKMAEKHAAAMEAHVRGKPGLAIKRLQQLAIQAPSAPQIYSSLGLVYEDMLKETRRKSIQEERDPVVERRHDDGSKTVSFADDHVKDDPEVQLLDEQLRLAKKSYGNYHIAALLCKKDPALWDRSGDAAAQVAELQGCHMTLPDALNSAVTFHRSEKRRWLEEARNDYRGALELQPSGVGIHLKLASTLIDLGHLSEALTLMTKLKTNRHFDTNFRAWLLYADLMLRVGHECSRWSMGIETNDSYMFRRWLRKHCDTFEWKERRLQALVKALEVAAGSGSCQQLIAWTKERAAQLAEKRSTSDEKQGDEVDEEDNDLMDQNNEVELVAFDKTTEEMALDPNSLESNERSNARVKLIERQKTTVDQTAEQMQTQESTESSQNKLSISASYRTVCEISVLLLRHMIDLELYSGGKLVGECVSHYMKERAARCDKGLRLAGASETNDHEPATAYAMKERMYDSELRLDGDGDNEDVAALSDDEELKGSGDSELLSTFSRGLLNPDVLFLYGLCLAHMENQAYFSAQCIKAVRFLPLESESWLEEEIEDTSLQPQNCWLNVERSAYDNLTRTTGLALVSFSAFECCQTNNMDNIKQVADEMDKLNHQSRLIKELGLLFVEHVVDMKAFGFVEYALSDVVANPVIQSRINRIVRVLVADTSQTMRRLRAVCVDFKDMSESDFRAALLEGIESLADLLSSLWRIKAKGIISRACREIICVLADTFQLASDYCNKCPDFEWNQLVAEALTKPVGIICYGEPLPLSDRIERSWTEMEAIPFETSWLSHDLALLAQRTFNCVVSTNVSLFSGWNMSEFSVRLLDEGAYNFFGVVMEKGYVAGCLSPETEEEVALQWESIKPLLPSSLTFGFRRRLSILRETPWYRKMHERHTRGTSRQVVFHAEDKCLEALLNFSRLCILVAKGSEVQTKLPFMALSVLVPISQFCLNELLWTSAVGKSSSRAARFQPWVANTEKKQSVVSTRKKTRSRREQYLRELPPEHKDAAVQEWFTWEDSKHPQKNFLRFPITFLQSMWVETTTETSEPHGASTGRPMEHLESNLRSMRACYTIQATEKAALNVSTALLDLVCCEDCNNPFLCLAQAAMFASQGPKLGTSDRYYQARLPKLEDCDERLSLTILGRADCLQSIHFYREAAFLCAFIAQVCAYQREDEEHWNSRWTAVTLVMYDISVKIRMTATMLMSTEGVSNDEWFCWDPEVTAELHRAYNSGNAMKESLASGQTLPDFNLPSVEPDFKCRQQAADQSGVLIQDKAPEPDSNDAVDESSSEVNEEISTEPEGNRKDDGEETVVAV